MGLDIPTSLGLPFIIRVFFPGLVAWSLVGYILVPPFGFRPAGFSLDQQVVLFAIASLLFGMTLFSLDYVIFTFYEGRFYWPRFLSERMTHRLQRKVEFLLQRSDDILAGKDALRPFVEAGTATSRERERFNGLAREYKEVWFKLRTYPEEGETRFADRPTIMGNMFSGAEKYPLDRYGMDPIFFWSRLVLLMSKDRWEFFDQTKAQVDFLVYTSFFLLLYSPIHLIVFGLRGNYLFASLAFLWLAGSYLLYRASLKVLRQYLEGYKSVFDVGREDLRKLVDPSIKGRELERALWVDVWRVLQYGMDPISSVVVMIKLRKKDPAIAVEEFTKAALLKDVRQIKGDYDLMGSITTTSPADTSSRINALQARPDVEKVAYIVPGP